jgi:5-formyltetrahydrofolate cyclo-ligase
VSGPGARTPHRHDRDAGGDPALLAAKSALRDEVWDALTAARVARFPGARNRISNFVGAEAAARRLRETSEWKRAETVKANPDSAQLPVRRTALEDGRTVYMAVPRLAEPEPFFLLDPDHLADPPRKAASIAGATRSARRVAVEELRPVDLVVTGCVAVGEDGRRLGKGGGFADLEFALAAAAGLIGPETVVVTTVHELQVRPAGAVPTAAHDAPVDLVVTPDRMIDCRGRRGPRPTDGIRWSELSAEKVAFVNTGTDALAHALHVARRHRTVAGPQVPRALPRLGRRAGRRRDLRRGPRHRATAGSAKLRRGEP